MTYITRTINVILAFLLVFQGINAAVRPPAVAGSFYPADSATLAEMVSGHLNSVPDYVKVPGELVALIVPHAGLVFSGPIAAYSYKLLKNSGTESVILCGPSHRMGFDGISVYGPGVTWQTPFGGVPCDDSLCNRLLTYSRMSVVEEPHGQEHCLEVQLPYLQTVLDKFTIVPMLIGDRSPVTTQLCADALGKLKTDKKTVMIASTDWQHYRPSSEGWKLDSAGMACVANLDPDALEDYLESGKTEACGGAAAVAVMKAARAKGANKVLILKYGDSGDVTGDKESVVGYLAAAIYRAGVTGTQAVTPKKAVDLSELTGAEKEILLKIARAALDSRLSKKHMPEFKLTNALTRKAGVFVTLKKDGRLRGCIGYTTAFRALHQAVSECAIKAALEDPRFPDVQASELPELTIEISVLTPLQEVKKYDDIEIGRDGLMITLQGYRGLLLPQVAVENGWDKDRFLAETCRKAGLRVDAYRHPEAKVEKFQAIVFSEEE